jgi:gamma-glutamylcyclotransferase (GGCT)/AIG2-like uncharacterized protein YtfP
VRVDPPRLFVYGTLLPGGLRWPFLQPFATGARPADVPGTLYDSGYGWPVATLTGADDGALVPGTLVDLDPARAAEALRAMDEIEATATDLLARVAVRTTAGEMAWAYHCAAPQPEMTRIARWVSVDER